MNREAAEHKAEHETMGREVSAAMSGESAALGQGTANPKAMTRTTMRALCQLNAEFYKRNAASFSQTRTAPWEGWRRCMAACRFDGLAEAAFDQPANAQTADQAGDTQTVDQSADAAAQGLDDQAGEQAAESPAFQDQTSATQPINDPSTEGAAACSQAAALGLSASRSLTRSVLDIACGNLRFEAFLANAYPHIDWSFFAVDNCEPLVASGQEDIAKKEKICQQLSSIPEIADYSQNEEYVKMKARHDEVLVEIENLKANGEDAAVETLKSEKEELQAHLDEVNSTIAKASMNVEIDERIWKLQEEQKEIGQKVADQEQILYLLEEFIRFKLNKVSESINSHFKTVNFKLFEMQLNGGMKDCCECTVNGVPYSTLNSGHRIVAGLDIIRSLSELYGVIVPIFVDNAESLNDFNVPDMDAQLILLSVSADKQLKVEGV